MKAGFYPKLALDGIRKNKRMYLPYIFTCIGMVAMTYIIAFIRFSPVVSDITGGNTLQGIMLIGVAVMIFFSGLFLFYTNSFLIKRRKKEFGLYNILGMGKRNISAIVFWESLFIAAAALIFGLGAGIVFSKLAELGAVNLLNGKIEYNMSVPKEAFKITAIAFTAIFALVFLNTLRQIWFSDPISLLKSENTGEKPPKANWFLGIAGIIILAAAYYLAVSIEDPISATVVFMIAVLMVIAATYLIMISGSVLFCRILQKNKRYYYKPNHFISVSSMAYRMKRNGAGLASICILATMVLVMISSTTALFIGSEDVINGRYPRDINTWFRMYENKDITEEGLKMFENTIDGVLEQYGADITNSLKYHCVSTSGLLTEDGELIFDKSAYGDFDINTFSDVHQVYIVSVEDYNESTGANEATADDEVLIYAPRGTFTGDSFGFFGQKQYRVKKIIKDRFECPDMSMNIVPSIMVISPNVAEMTKGLKKTLTDITGEEVTLDFAYYKWYYCFDTSLSDEEDIMLHESIEEAIANLRFDGYDTFISSVESREY